MQGGPAIKATYYFIASRMYGAVLHYTTTSLSSALVRQQDIRGRLIQIVARGSQFLDGVLPTFLQF